MTGRSLQTQISSLTRATQTGAIAGRPRRSGWRQVLVGVVVVLSIFFGVGLWAAVTPIGSAAIAPGTVTVSAGPQLIQHLEEGIVSQILVRDGDKVKKGDVLIRLDGTRPDADLALIRSEVDLSEATAARLTAEEAERSAIDFPADLRDRADVPAVARLIANQEALFKARARVLKGQTAILNQRIIEYLEQIKGLQAVVASKRRQLTLVRGELEALSGLIRKKLVTMARILSLRREAAQLEGDRGQAVADIARARQGIGEAQQQIYQLTKQQQDEDARDLLQVQQQLTQSRERLVAAEDVVHRLDIVAPMDGTVFNLRVRTVGAVISPNTILMEIIPDHSPLIVEADLKPKDIDSVRVGDRVSVRVIAANTRLTPVIFGHVAEISADRVTAPGQEDAAAARSFYRVRVSVPPVQVARLGAVKLHVGMPVETLIQQGEQTVLHYALKPLLDSLAYTFRER